LGVEAWVADMPVSILPIKNGGSVIVRTAEERDTAALARLMTQLGYPTSPAEMGERLDAILRSHGYYEDARGRGVGRILIEQVESWLLQREVTAIYIQQREPTQRRSQILPACGYRQTGLRFAKEFAPRSLA
jgi:GNAT superfamily N-acetyltransferase